MVCVCAHALETVHEHLLQANQGVILGGFEPPKDAHVLALADKQVLHVPLAEPVRLSVDFHSDRAYLRLLALGRTQPLVCLLRPGRQRLDAVHVLDKAALVEIDIRQRGEQPLQGETIGLDVLGEQGRVNVASWKGGRPKHPGVVEEKRKDLHPVDQQVLHGSHLRGFSTHADGRAPFTKEGLLALEAEHLRVSVCGGDRDRLVDHRMTMLPQRNVFEGVFSIRVLRVRLDKEPALGLQVGYGLPSAQVRDLVLLAVRVLDRLLDQAGHGTAQPAVDVGPTLLQHFEAPRHVFCDPRRWRDELLLVVRARQDEIHEPLLGPALQLGLEHKVLVVVTDAVVESHLRHGLASPLPLLPV
mmetsp:Transcript_24320/g.41851  ORF Transcript_24320/g.41851 Transcript_24320/m.41851 type:complete len:357 (+) Transcript_24320:2087-3157(+)